MSSKSCFFIGHRNAPATLRPLLLETIEMHITEYGVTDFYVGHYGTFDSLAANALCKIKERRPHIKAYLLLAYPPSFRQIDIPEGLDGSILLDGQEKSPPRYAITNLNRHMIREVDYVISYVRYITDGSHKLMDYATARERKGKLKITNLAEHVI